MDVLRLIAICKAKPGQEEKVQHALLPLADMGRSRPGCVSYEICRDRQDHAQFVFYEIWEDLAALDLHREHPDFKALVETLLPMLTAPFTVMQLQKLA